MAQNISDKSRQAQWLAKQGMHVFMLRPGLRVPVGGCGRCRSISPDHVPHLASECECIPANGGMNHCHGAHAATTDPDVINGWWTGKFVNAGIGVHLAKSGLIMLDIDSHKDERVDAATALRGRHKPTISEGLTAADGWDAMAFLAGELYRADPWADEEAVRVLTPSGGLHIWYRVDQPAKYRNIDGKLAWQVDVKAGSAFGVAPGTRVVDRGEYRGWPGSSWGDGPTALPAWLDAEIGKAGGHVQAEPSKGLRGLLSASRRAGGPSAQPPSVELVETVLGEALAMLGAAPAGQRNATLNAAAFKLGRALLSRDETLRDQLAQALEDAATAGGTPASEARATVASGLMGGMRAGLK